jgi:hypothetical protein
MLTDASRPHTARPYTLDIICILIRATGMDHNLHTNTQRRQIWAKIIRRQEADSIRFHMDHSFHVASTIPFSGHTHSVWSAFIVRRPNVHGPVCLVFLLGIRVSIYPNFHKKPRDWMTRFRWPSAFRSRCHSDRSGTLSIQDFNPFHQTPTTPTATRSPFTTSPPIDTRTLPCRLTNRCSLPQNDSLPEL